MEDVTGKTIAAGDVVVYTASDRNARMRFGIVESIVNNTIHIRGEPPGHAPVGGHERTVRSSLKFAGERILVIDKPPRSKWAILNKCRKAIENQ